MLIKMYLKGHAHSPQTTLCLLSLLLVCSVGLFRSVSGELDSLVGETGSFLLPVPWQV